MAVADQQWKVDFATRLAKDVNVNFYTVLGWEQAEGGPSGNPLNVRPGQNYGTPIAAADETARFLTTEDTGNFYADIRAAFDKSFSTPDQEIAAEAHAIAYNPHFNTSGNTVQYERNIDTAALLALYKGVQGNSSIDPSGNIKNPPDNPGGIFGGFQSVEDAIKGIGDFFHWFSVGENDLRILMAMGGVAAILLGAYVAFK